MPFNAFRPTSYGEPPLHTCIHNLTHMAIRFEPGTRSAPLTPEQVMFGDDMSSKRFDIELEYIRVSPYRTVPYNFSMIDGCLVTVWAHRDVYPQEQ